MATNPFSTFPRGALLHGVKNNMWPVKPCVCSFLSVVVQSVTFFWNPLS